MAAGVSLSFFGGGRGCLISVIVDTFPRLLEPIAALPRSRKYVLIRSRSRYGEDPELTEGYVKDLWE